MFLNRSILLSPADEGTASGGEGQQQQEGGQQAQQVFEDGGQQQQASGQQQQQQQSGEGQQQQQAAVKAGLSPDDVAEILKKAGVGQQQQPAQQQQQRQYTQEEFDQAMRVFKPQKDLVTRLRAGLTEGKDEDVLAVLSDLVNGISNQAVTMSAYNTARIQQELMQMVDPIQQYVNAAKEQQLRVDFYGQYKDLEPYAAIVDSVTDKLKAAGAFAKGVTKEQAFKLVAEESQKLVQQLRAAAGESSGQQQQPQQQQQRTAQSSRRMSSLSGGGQGGAGDSQGAQGGKKLSPSLAVFED